jgi:hypothetical protein
MINRKSKSWLSCYHVQKIALTIMLLLQSSSLLQAQSGLAELTMIEQQFRQFKYDSVIVKSDRILNSGKNLSSQTKIEIYRMKAISYYSLSQLNFAFKSFVEILELDKNFQLDGPTTSPKIVQFFDDIKKGFVEQQQVPVRTIEIVKTDTVRLISDTGFALRNSLFRSMVLPGWGHLYIKQKKKGLLLTGMGVATFAASVYSTLDCRDKQELYLNEIDKSLMDQRYDDYNSAYKIRNSFWTAFSVLWIYTQIDLLFFNEDNFPGEMKTAFLPSINNQGVFLNYIISF